MIHAIIWLVVAPAFTCYGYNLGVTGGLLTLDSFVGTFPQLDTVNTTGAKQHYNSTIQGTFYSRPFSISPAPFYTSIQTSLVFAAWE